MAIAKRRILFVIKNLQQGGTERQVLRMMRALDRERFEIALCTLSPEIHYEDLPDGEPRYPLAATGRKAICALRAVMEDFRPDLVHSFRDTINRWVWKALSGLRFHPQWLMSVRGRPVLPLDLMWAGLMYRRAFRVTVNSLGVMSTLQRYTWIPRDCIAVVPNLIDEAAFAPASAGERSAAREALFIRDADFVWVLPGRISWVKNQFGLLIAIWLLVRRRALPARAVVILAGRRRDLIPSALVPRLISLLGLGDHVRLMDAVKAPRVLYAAADALVLPSIAEGMPNVTLEAQLCALPVVVTPEANRDLLVTDGHNGFVVPSLSPGALATKMARMMALSTNERHEMGTAGRVGLLRRLSSKEIARELTALYDQAFGAAFAEDGAESEGSEAIA